MTILNILEYPDERLHTVAENVVDFDEKLEELVKNMAETMYLNKGIGLAATQVNVHKRLIVIDISEEKNNLITLINPVLERHNGIQEYAEGCLSVPGIFEKIKRYENITVSYFDLKGKKKSINADGLLSVCIQHEMDHLLGKVFVDYLSQLKKTRIKTKLSKLNNKK
jgi:peptide deformylase